MVFLGSGSPRPAGNFFPNIDLSTFNETLDKTLTRGGCSLLHDSPQAGFERLLQVVVLVWSFHNWPMGHEEQLEDLQGDGRRWA